MTLGKEKAQKSFSKIGAFHELISALLFAQSLFKSKDARPKTEPVPPRLTFA